MNNIQTILTAALSAITGGSFLKFLEVWLSRSKQKTESDRAFRDELRANAEGFKKQATDLKDELKDVELELDKWKLKYWDIYMAYSQFKLQVLNILIQNGIKPEEVFPKEMKEENFGTPA